MNNRYLIDTGAEVSVFPATRNERKRINTAGLAAANGSVIATFGTKKIDITIVGTKIQWDFMLAGVTKPILGNDLFLKHHYAIDIVEKKLINLNNSKTEPLFNTSQPSLALHSISTNSNTTFHDIINEFPEILTFNPENSQNHSVTQFIETNGYPCHSKVRRLSTDKLAAAKEFRKLEEMQIIRRSNSPWSSPLHMVLKESGEYRPCGDYRKLNNQTIQDRYPVPHIQEFSINLRKNYIFENGSS